MAAVIYTRQSLDKTGDGLGIARQVEACQRLCEARAWPVATIIEDNDRSASRGVREGYAELLAMIENRAVDRVVVLRLDRLLRRVTDLEALIELTERTGVKITTVEGDLDLSNPSGRLMGRIMASVARGEIETKSARQKLANAQAAAAGKPHGSRRPYGYEAGPRQDH
jgi:DNA invertase Pin-like site-specific DNA recombinase